MHAPPPNPQPLPQPGPLVLLGSGETAPASQRIYHWVMSELQRARGAAVPMRVAAPMRVAILETPAGFQPNSALVADEVGAYISRHLSNFRPSIERVAARARGTPFSPDDAALLGPLRTAKLMIMGPGSPTYAARQLAGSAAWSWMQARHRLGAGLLLSSAATLAAGCHTLPVYEIYKAGADLHWAPGLDLLAPFGLQLLVVSHWNNSDGGAGLDTSRCYVGRERFDRLRALLPHDAARVLVGIDEQTALCLDPAAGVATVMGMGGVTLEVSGAVRRLEPGEQLALAELGNWRLPAAGEGIEVGIWCAAVADWQAAQEQPAAPAPAVAPAAVLALVEQRQAARASGAWAEADRLRAAIRALGWQVQDTPAGPQLAPDDV